MAARYAGGASSSEAGQCNRSSSVGQRIHYTGGGRTAFGFGCAAPKHRSSRRPKHTFIASLIPPAGPLLSRARNLGWGIYSARAEQIGRRAQVRASR